MDLTTNFPPSPYDTLAGLVMLPRTAAKARAKAQGTLGEYLYPCPLDALLLEFLQLDPEDFSARATAGDDCSLSAWVEEHIADKQSVKATFNNTMRHLKPSDEDRAEWFDAAQQALGRNDYYSFFDHLDADEERF